MLTDDVKQLIDRNLQANLKLLSRAGGVLRSAGELAKQPGRLRGTDAKAVASDLVKLQLDFYSRLADQSVQYLNAVVSLAESTLGEQAGTASSPAASSCSDDIEVDAAPAATPHVVPTDLGGQLGETLRFQFQLDNPNPEPVNASLESRDWLGPEGLAVAADCLRLEPAATVIAPHGARTVQGQLVIDGRFVAGQVYETVIRVVGFPGREIGLRLTVAAAVD